MRPRLLCAAAGLLLAAACAPSVPPPVPVVVLEYDYTSGAFGPKQEELSTVTDLTSMTGSAAQIVGGAKFSVDSNGIISTTNNGHSVDVAFIQSEGVYVPADFDSLGITTTYYNFERANKFFNTIAKLDPNQFGAIPVFYLADYEAGGQAVLDDAYYQSQLQGVLVLPFQVLQAIPLSMNLGLMGHEYSHAVLNYRVFNKAFTPQIPSTWEADFGASPGANLLAALDEGQADVFGFGISCSPDLSDCDPEFMGRSLPSDVDDERRLDVPHCMTAALLQQLTTQAYDDFTGNVLCDNGCHYQLAAVFSSAMWAAAADEIVVGKLGAPAARNAIFQALWNAVAGGSDAPGASSWKDIIQTAAGNQLQFTLDSTQAGVSGSVLQSVIDGASDPDVKSALCSAFMDRFNLTRDQIAHCPATAQSYGKCAAP